jgi:hypothetical protein
MEMNRQDQRPAEQLDIYIDASQKGRAVQGEFPFVDQLLAMANNIEAGPALRRRTTKALSAKRAVHRPVRWLSAAAVALLVLAAFMTVPALRSVARTIISVFAVQETDQNPALRPTVAPLSGVTLEDPSAPSASQGLTLEQIQAQVSGSSKITFDVIPPAYVPAGFDFDAGMVDEFGRMVLLTYVSDDRLSLFHVRMHDLANPNPAVEVQLPVGASSTIETVIINGQAGQYAQGDYGADGAWDAAAPVQTFTWRNGDVLYVITTHEQNARISRADLLAVAESIRP